MKKMMKSKVCKKNCKANGKNQVECFVHCVKNGFWMLTLMKAPAQRENSGQWWRLCHRSTHWRGGSWTRGCWECVMFSNQAHHLTHTRRVWLMCVHEHKCQKHSTKRTHTYTQAALCLDNLTTNHHGNWTLIAICASLFLHVSLCLSVIYSLT